MNFKIFQNKKKGDSFCGLFNNISNFPFFFDIRASSFISPKINIHSTPNELKHRLSKVRGFPATPSSISFIEGPTQFFSEMIDAIKIAKKRIILSSLYLGTDKYGNELVNTLQNACSSNPNLEVFILLDCLRGTRGKENSVTLLQPLLSKYPNRFSLSLWHTPKLHGLLKKLIPSRINEIIGVHHIKAYIFDQDIIISGANMSDTYFSNRQDRYIWIRNHESLCEYMFRVLKTIASISFKVTEDGMLKAPDCPSPIDNPKQYTQFASEKLSLLLNVGEYEHQWKEMFSKGGTWIFPTLQMGLFGIRQDELIVSEIFKMNVEDSHLYVSSPYLNLTRDYLDLIFRNKGQTEIVTASPKANSFFKAKDISRLIPEAYSLIERKFFANLVKKGINDRVKIYEYIKSDWTFHGKGLWFQFPQQELPSITVIGSANLGKRSAERDLEAQLVIITDDKELQEKLHKERVNMFAAVQPVDDNVFLQDQHKVSWLLKLVYKVGSSFM